MTDNLEKYLRLNIDFPNKAGKLDSLLQAQKRLVTKISRTAGISQDVKELLFLVADGFDVSGDLLAYMKTTLQEVANDAGTLIEGAKTRNILEDQSAFIIDLMKSDEPTRPNTKTA